MEFSIQLQRKGRTEYYGVFVKIEYRDAWKFIRCFYTLSRAEKFVAEVRKDFAKGDYSWLTLKS